MMQIYNKFSSALVIDKAGPVPYLKMQIAESRCLHCGRLMRFPVENAFIDWQKVAEKYRSELERSWALLDQMVKDIDVMHPGDNPVMRYLANRLAALIMDCFKHLDDQS